MKGERKKKFDRQLQLVATTFLRVPFGDEFLETNQI